MTGIRVSQKKKDLSRLLYRICGSGSTFFQLQNLKKMKGGHFGDIKKFSKKSQKAEKGAGKVS